MKYCRKCVLPDTRPNLKFDPEGVCSACRHHELRLQVNWDTREQVFKELIDSVTDSTSGYNCLIPVSGGKDSTWQVLKCLEYGLRPLTLSWRPPGRTTLGERNLRNLVGQGVDHLDYTINPTVERSFTHAAFVERGIPGLPMHMAIYNIPLRVALAFGIPLVVWGENSAVEYGDGDDERDGSLLTDEWLTKYGVTDGTRLQDWVSGELSEEDLTAYAGPMPSELERHGIRGIFLGHYFRWDPQETLAIAKASGFEVSEEGPLVGIYNFADIDDAYLAVHHWIKWYKFGFTRTFDNLSLEIRNRRVSRQEAIEVLRISGDEMPVTAIEQFCGYLQIDEEQFSRVCERFRNPEVWKLTGDVWSIPDFIVEDWTWRSRRS